MKISSLINIICITVLVLIIVPPIVAATLEETFKKKIDFEPEGYVYVQNTNGRVEVEGWNKNVIMIEAKKYVKASTNSAAKQYMKEIRIDITQNKKEIVIKTHFPRRSNNFWNWIFRNDESGYINYKLFVPKQTDIDIELTNGGISLKGVEGRAELNTTNGEITGKEIVGIVDAYTTNGSIEIELSEVYSGNDMQFQTTNGSIKLYLPENIRCNISARTSNGSLDTEFPLTLKGNFSSKKIEGKIKGGGPLIRLKTTNGNIQIYKR